MARMLAPINSVKHYVNVENTDITAGTRSSILIVDATAATSDGVSLVKEGSLVKAIFLEFWVKSNASAGNDAKFQFCLEKAPNGVDTVSFTEMNTMGVYNNKKNVLFYSQGVLGDLTTQAIPVVRQWFKIPKGKQRFGLGDRLLVAISATTSVIARCGFATFKEYT